MDTMDHESILVAFMDAAGPETDPDWARSILEMHGWDLGAAMSDAFAPPQPVEPAVREPMRTNYVDQLIPSGPVGGPDMIEDDIALAINQSINEHAFQSGARDEMDLDDAMDKSFADHLEHVMKISRIDDELEEALRISRELSEREAATSVTPALAPASASSSSRAVPGPKRGQPTSTSSRQQSRSQDSDTHAPRFPQPSAPSASTQRSGGSFGSGRAQQARPAKTAALAPKPAVTRPKVVAPSRGSAQENDPLMPNHGLIRATGKAPLPHAGTTARTSYNSQKTPPREAPILQHPKSFATSQAASASSSRPSARTVSGGLGQSRMEVDDISTREDVPRGSKSDGVGSTPCPGGTRNPQVATNGLNNHHGEAPYPQATLGREEKWLRQMEEQQRQGAREEERRLREEETQRRVGDKERAEDHKMPAARAARPGIQGDREQGGREDKRAMDVSGDPPPNADEGAEKEAKVLRCLQNLKKLPPAEAQAAVKTLHAYISNLAKNPMDIKFHKINTENKNFASTVAKHQDAITLLKLCGFQQEGSFLVMDEGFMKSKGSFLWNIVAKLDFLRE